MPISPAWQSTAARTCATSSSDASARETAARVAAGAIARQLLAHAGVGLTSHVFTIGNAGLPPDTHRPRSTLAAALPDDSPFAASIAAIDAADDRGDRRAPRRRGDTLGGAFEVIATRCAGRPRQLRAVGSQARRPARPGADVDPGDQGRRHRARAGGRRVGLARASTTRSSPIRRRPHVTGVSRPTNNAGGLEGGVTNGEDAASVGVDEADLDADETATIRRSHDNDGVAAPPSSAATSARCRRRLSSARRWSRSMLADALVDRLRRRHDRRSRSRARGCRREAAARSASSPQR